MAISLSAAACLASGVLAADPSGFVAGSYQPDTVYPEFMPLWREGWKWTDENGEKVRYAYEGMPLGGYLFVQLRNTGETPLAVNDVLLDGVSLAQGIAPERALRNEPDEVYPSSLQFSKLPASEVGRLVAVGEPVWWKAEPADIAPGGLGQITVRLRRDPRVDSIPVRVPAAGTQGSVQSAPRQPRFFSIGFSSELDRIFAYVRHPSGRGVAPARVLMDDADITARCVVAADPAVNTVPIVIPLGQPLKEGTYHVFQAVYADGSSACTGIAAWRQEMVYGMWGYSREGRTPRERADLYLAQMYEHGINALMYSIGSEVIDFLHTPEGREYAKRTGLRLMAHWPGNQPDPVYTFLIDEPDAADFNSKMLDPYRRIGSRGQCLVRRAACFRRKDPHTPILLNVNNTFKPENWYTYAQLADVAGADPYYQESVQSVLRSDPTNLGAYLKPTYVYAVGAVYQSAAAPKPMHLILHACRFDLKPEECPYRGPTPEEKRVEVFYGLAAGAKSFSYWWYTPYGEYYGVGGDSPEMKALWREIGLLGAEVRTAGPLIVRSSPADLPVKAPRLLWVRTLLVGDEALVVLVVNDNMASDRLGTIIRPVQRAVLGIQVPGWMPPADVFEIAADGVRDVRWSQDKGTVSADLETVQVTRMLVVAKDPHLRGQLKALYERDFAEHARKLLAQTIPKPKER
ncbi:MAG TPA: hypothetical protein PKY77_05430 [Phycisphaerae bacterium]|nr:hypothetical protein [Phycisphaerae bacterium]HRY68955.1 hypothetical protein [Phycisphaerae bacterium]HSA25782.1 hypothetical protein [Phycisphaerae bacterium]